MGGPEGVERLGDGLNERLGLRGVGCAVRVVAMNWLITDKGDQDVRRLIDGESIGEAPHYSRQSPGNRQYCRNGQNLVFVTSDLLATWITFRPTPGKAIRQDKLDAWECALFRNEGPILSSILIREAVLLTCALWGLWPKHGFITYIKADAVRTQIPGYCYRRAGWVRWGAAHDGKPRLRAPKPHDNIKLPTLQWRGDRGGILRKRLFPTTP